MAELIIVISILGILITIQNKNEEISKLKGEIRTKSLINDGLCNKAKRVDELESSLEEKKKNISILQQKLNQKEEAFNKKQYSELLKEVDKLKVDLERKKRKVYRLEEKLKDTEEVLNKKIYTQLKQREELIKKYNELDKEKKQLDKSIKNANIFICDNDYYEALFKYLEDLDIEEDIDEEIKREFLNSNDIKKEYFKEGKSIDDIRERVKSLARSNIWDDEAIELNKILIVDDYKDSNAYTRLAKCYLQKKDYLMAEKMYKAVLKFDSYNTISINGINRIKNLILADKKSKKIELLNSKYKETLIYLKSIFREETIIYSYDEKFKIFYEDEYHPYRKGRNKNFRAKEDGNILRLKENNSEIIEQFTEVFNIKLRKLNDIFKNENIIIVSMPSSTVGKKNGINFVAKNISKNLQWSDESDSLKRIYDIEKLSNGGNRNKDIHLNSIEYLGDYTNLDEKIIILIDDVITTGNSLGAVREILIAYGAKYIITIGIAKTFDEFYSNEEKVKIWNC